MLHDHILVRVVIESEQSGIALPKSMLDERKLTATTGIAAAVGPECKWVKEGDFVFYKQFVGNILEHETLPEGAAHVVVSEHDILGRI